MSKRKLQWFVDNKKVEGWFDPRFPTVQGMVRRGLKVEALQEFILLQGASKNSNLMEWDKLWTINKRMIDPVCPRHACVLVDTKVKVTMAGAPQAEVKTVPKHKKFEGAGFKATLMSPNLIIDMKDTLAHGDQNMRQLQKGEHLQIERKGYYMVDKACMPGHPLRLLSVPDGGKSKTQKR